MINLYEHQKKIIASNPKKAGIFLSTGSGKTTIALLLARGTTLVVCPKTVRQARTWEREAERLGVAVPYVLSKEEFRSKVNSYLYRTRFDTVIIDEAHTFAGVLPEYRWRNKTKVPRVSQFFAAAHTYLAETNPEQIYLLTATPIRSPMSVWGLATLLGGRPSFEEFRSTFYVPIQINGHERWLPRKDDATKDRLAAYVRRLGVVGRLEDWFDVPTQTHRVIACELSKEQRDAIRELPLSYPDPLVLVGKTHQAEQGKSKLLALESLQKEFDKVLVFARYREQIQHIECFFKDNGIMAYTLTGDTKNREALLQEANASSECVFIAQSSISAGYELPTFRCTVYASLDWSVVNLEQSLGRTLRANALAKNLYVYLLAGDVDRGVYAALQTKQDFNERIYAEKRSSIHD